MLRKILKNKPLVEAIFELRKVNELLLRYIDSVDNETSLIEETVEKTIPEEMLEYNVVVRIPPKKKYTTQMEIKSIRRGTPRIVEPEGLL